MNNQNMYPFVTKTQIKTRLDNEPEFRLQAMAILHTLQTEYEQETKSTRSKNRQGFMSSHAVKGCKVAEKIKAGETLTVEDQDIVDRIAPRYSRQLATFFRAQAIANDPALAKVAGMFSADRNLPPVEAQQPEEMPPVDDVVVSVTPEAETFGGSIEDAFTADENALPGWDEEIAV